MDTSRWSKKKSILFCFTIRIILSSIIPLASSWTVIIFLKKNNLSVTLHSWEMIPLTRTSVAHRTDTGNTAQVDVPVRSHTSLDTIGTSSTGLRNDPSSSAPNTSQVLPIARSRSLPWEREHNEMVEKGWVLEGRTHIAGNIPCEERSHTLRRTQVKPQLHHAFHHNRWDSRHRDLGYVCWYWHLRAR